MRAPIFSLLAVAAVVAGQESVPVDSHVQAEAEPAVVVLEPLAARQGYLRLPNLAFELSIEPRCEAALGIRSVLVSIADTRLRLDRGGLDDSAVLRTTLRLPRQQAGQLRVDDFCRRGRDHGGTRLEIRGAFTARLSLRCGDDERESVTYTTLPLDIVLECRVDAAADGSAALPAHSTPRF